MITCSMCGVEKEDLEFSWRNEAKQIRSRGCKACHAAYSRKHYAENKSMYLSKNLKHRPSLERKRKDFITDHLRNNPCVDCGENDIVVLEFDHRGDKSFNIGSHGLSVGIERLKAEIAKCDVRCCNCHRKRHSKGGSWWRWQRSRSTPCQF